MQNAGRWLGTLARQMRDDVAGGAMPSSEELTVREFLQRFGFARRTSRHVSEIRRSLQEHGLRTTPDFVGIWVDRRLSLELIPEDGDPQALEDPTVRVGELEAAHRPPTTVARDEEVSVATTKMALNDYSQLPVMQGKYELNGIISWKTIGERYMVGIRPQYVRECMEVARTVDVNDPLLTAVRDISEHGYVLVRAEDNSISGIVTASDVTQQFSQLTGPFVLIGEIEGHLRNLLHGKFTLEQITEAAEKSGSTKDVERVADLTFAGYCTLLGGKENWECLGLAVDRKVFLSKLHSVREIRNDVMHFSPDGLDEEQTNELEGVAQFFRQLAQMGIM